MRGNFSATLAGKLGKFFGVSLRCSYRTNLVAYGLGISVAASPKVLAIPLLAGLHDMD